MIDPPLYQMWYRRAGRKRWLKGIDEPQPYSWWCDPDLSGRKTRLQCQRKLFPDYEYCIRRVGESPNA